MRAVSGIAGFGTVTLGLSAAAGSVGDGTRLEVAEFRNLPEYGGSIVNQRREWVGYSASFSYSIIYFKKEGTKKENSRFLTSISRTPNTLRKEEQGAILITGVRLEVEQNQLVAETGQIVLGGIRLECL